MNNQFPDRVKRGSAQYEYDADFDCYRRVSETIENTHIQQYGWIYVSILLTAVCFWVTLANS